MKVYVSLVALLGLLQAGCSWSTRDALETAAWADDDSRVAHIRALWQQKRVPHLLERYEYRDYRYEMITRTPAGGDELTVLPLRSGRVWGDLYYMASEGYLIYSEVEEPTVRTYQVLTAQNTRVEIASTTANHEPCGLGAVVPSPDGGVLAVVEKRLPGGAFAPPGPPPPQGQECNGHELTVRFVDATSRSTLATESWTVSGEYDFAWVHNQGFVFKAGTEAWSLNVGQPRVAIAIPACLYPRTTSSMVSSNRERLDFTSDTSVPLTHRRSNEPAWGECF